MVLRVKRGNLIFSGALFSYMFALFMENLNINGETAALIKHFFVLCAVLLLLLYFLSSTHRLPQIYNSHMVAKLIAVSIFMFTAGLSVITRNYFLIVVLLFSICLEEIEYTQLLRYSMIIIVTISLFVVILSVVGILPNEKIVRDTFYNYGLTRYSLGFKGSIFLPNILVYVAGLYYSINKRISAVSCVVFQILGVILYMICDSRNGLITLEILMFALLIAKYNTKNKSIMIGIAVVCQYSYAFMSIMSLVALQLYRRGNPIMRKVNEILSGRLQWSLENMWNSPFKFINFMNHDTFTRGLKYAYDNGYYYIIARYGYLFLIIFLIITIVIAVELRMYKNNNAVVCFAILAILNFVDNGFVSYGWFPYMILGYHCLFSRLLGKRK